MFIPQESNLIKGIHSCFIFTHIRGEQNIWPRINSIFKAACLSTTSGSRDSFKQDENSQWLVWEMEDRVVENPIHELNDRAIIFYTWKLKTKFSSLPWHNEMFKWYMRIIVLYIIDVLYKIYVRSRISN